MRPRYLVFIHKNYKIAKRPVRRYWANRPLQRLDEIWEMKKYKADEQFRVGLRKRLHALTFPYRFWTGDFR